MQAVAAPSGLNVGDLCWRQWRPAAGKGHPAGSTRSRRERIGGQGTHRKRQSILVGGELAMPGPDHGRERRPNEPARFDQARQQARRREHRQGRRAIAIGVAPRTARVTAGTPSPGWGHAGSGWCEAMEGMGAARRAGSATRGAGRLLSPDVFGSAWVEAALRSIEGVGPEGLRSGMRALAASAGSVDAFRALSVAIRGAASLRREKHRARRSFHGAVGGPSGPMLLFRVAAKSAGPWTFAQPAPRASARTPRHPRAARRRVAAPARRRAGWRRWS